MLSGSETVVTVTNTAGLFVGQNSRRVALLISSPRSNRITLSRNPGVTIDNGITLQTGQTYMPIAREQAGDWVTQSLYAVAAAGTETIGVVEVLEP